MNTNYYLIGLAVLVPILFVVVWDQCRRRKLKREDRNACSICGSKNTQRRHLRVRLPVEKQKSGLARFFSKEPDTLCQTQKKCFDKECISKGDWIEEKSYRKFFNPFRHLKSFILDDCTPNDAATSLRGPWRRQLDPNARKPALSFHPQPLPPPPETSFQAAGRNKVTS